MSEELNTDMSVDQQKSSESEKQSLQAAMVNCKAVASGVRWPKTNWEMSAETYWSHAMRHFVSFLGAIALIVLLTIQVLADFKSPAAKTAQSEFHSALTQADRARLNQVELARRKYLTSLKSAQLDATKKGDLDDAIRIREEIAAVESAIAGGSPDTPKPASKTPPTNVASWSYGDNRTVSFNSNGTGVYQAQAVGKVVPFQWARLPDDSVVLLTKDGYVDLLVFDADGKAFTKFSCGRKDNAGTLKGEPISK